MPCAHKVVFIRRNSMIINFFFTFANLSFCLTLTHLNRPLSLYIFTGEMPWIVAVVVLLRKKESDQDFPLVLVLKTLSLNIFNVSFNIVHTHTWKSAHPRRPQFEPPAAGQLELLDSHTPSHTPHTPEIQRKSPPPPPVSFIRKQARRGGGSLTTFSPPPPAPARPPARGGREGKLISVT